MIINKSFYFLHLRSCISKSTIIIFDKLYQHIAFYYQKNRILSAFNYSLVISNTYNTNYFKEEVSIMDFLARYGYANDPQALRSFLGRMLFSGEDVFKKVSVLYEGSEMNSL